ncbi:hypothetical protein HY338_00005 [Candidatus Gottesmanbacteria bacterium]|nr:hypothetical protein [Candidatus Gottesmanbacteria bacterium]
MEQKLMVLKDIYLYPLLLLTGFVIASTLFQSPNLAISLTTPLATTTLVESFLFYLFLTYAVDENDKSTLVQILLIDAVLLSLYLIFLYIGILPKNIQTPAGSLLSTVTFLAVLGIYPIYSLLKYFISDENEKNQIMQSGSWGYLYLFYGSAALLITTATIITSIHLATNQSPILLPLNFGWSIMLETLKNIRTLTLGIGPANFITAFTLSKPITINSSPVWNIVFTSSSSFHLNLLTEYGLFAGLMYVLIFIKAVKQLFGESLTKSHENVNFYSFKIMLVAVLFLQIILPTSMVLLTTCVILLAVSGSHKPSFEIDFSSLGFLKYLLIFPSIIMFSLVIFFGGKAYLAEMNFKKSLDSLINNQGTLAYNYQRQAIKLNPYIDRYHNALSQTNLALANALASKKNPTAEDQQNIPRLVQQAIDEARVSVNLFRTNVINWDNLTKTYSNIIGYAAGADNFAIQSQQQKITLDPLSPKNRIALGVLYLNLKKYPDAEMLFRQAIYLKPDLANAHYDLAVALRSQKKYDEAYKELQTSASLIPLDSGDMQKIEGELSQFPEAITATGSLKLKKVKTIENPTLDLENSSPSALNLLPSQKLIPTAIPQ